MSDKINGSWWFDSSIHLKHGDQIFKYLPDRRTANLHPNLVAWLPFDTSPTEDLCGGTWQTVGTVSIQDGALVVNATKGYVKRTGGYTLGGQDFTVCCHRYTSSGGNWFYFSTSETGAYNRISAYAYDSRFYLLSLNEASANGTVTITAGWHHICVTYKHSEKKFRGFFNGVKIVELSTTIPRTSFTMFNTNLNTRDNSSSTCKIKNWKLYDGIALWTENFTPPAL